MDYEKAYKKALERAATELETCGADESLRNMIYAIFPDELKESEDEKTRKELINFLKSPFMKENIADWKVAPWIAWLEKHTYTQRDVDDAYLKGVTDTKKVLENQSEQILANSANISKDEHSKQTNFFQNVSLTEFEEALADVCRGWIGEEIGWKDYIIRNANALLKICQKMQESAWSEEDDEIFGRIYYACVMFYDDEDTTLVNWLNAIKRKLKGE